jgi:carbonic anhydrase
MKESQRNVTFGQSPRALKQGDEPSTNDLNPNHSSRREFVRLTALAASVAGLACHSTARASNQPAAVRDPDAVLAGLLEGNKRFVSGRLIHPGRKPEDFAALAEGQAPLAAIVGCADSRVAPELIFDQGVGDLFVVRVAGNIVSGAGPLVKGSIEFAVAVLGVRLIVVLGHSQCGAVKAAIEHIDSNDALPGSIGDLIDPIRAAVTAVKGQPGDKLDNVIRANVERGVKRLESLDPILSKTVKSGGLKVVGAVYDLRSGVVKVLH